MLRSLVTVVVGLLVAVLGVALCAADARSDDAAGAAGDPPGDPPALVRLSDALEAGAIEVSARAANSYRRLTIEVRSRSKARQTIDVAGAHFEPEDGSSCQRLGVGPAVEAALSGHGDGSTRVSLAPGESVAVVLQTCCLDIGRPVPRTQKLRLAKQPLPAKAAALFRRWADHPRTPQDDVNSAVWQGAWDFDCRVAARTAREIEQSQPSGVFVRLRGGVAYVVRDGELRAVDAGGGTRFLGSRIWTAHPEEDGVWVVAQSPAGGRRLWRVPVTAENAPKSLLDVTADESVERVLEFGRGTLVVGSPCLRFVGADGAIQEILTPMGRVTSCRADDRGRLLLAESGAQGGAGSGRFALTYLDPGKLDPKIEHRIFNVRSVRVLPSGVHSLSDDGVAERIRISDGRRLDVDRSRTWRSILGGAPDVLWLEPHDGGAVASDPATGRERARIQRADLGNTGTLDVDPVTGDVAWVIDGVVRRFVLATSRTEVVADRPE